MAIAAALLFIVAGLVVFHALSRWLLTPLPPSWKAIREGDAGKRERSCSALWRSEKLHATHRTAAAVFRWAGTR